MKDFTCCGLTLASLHDLLQHFEEPRETRLGYAAAGFSGHGGAAEVGTWIWEALTTELEALLRVGILTQIEDLPLFVEGLAEDITSDLTTRIIFEPLSKFTASMVAEPCSRLACRIWWLIRW